MVVLWWRCVGVEKYAKLDMWCGSVLLCCSFVVVVLLLDCGFVRFLRFWWWCGGVVLVLEGTGSSIYDVKGFVVLLFSCCCVVVVL